MPITVKEIDGDGYHIFITFKIGRKKARFLVDTGASKTVLDQQALERFNPIPIVLDADQQAQSLGLGGGYMQTSMVSLKNLKIGDLKIKQYTAAVLNLAQVNHNYEQLGIKPIQGIIGCDLLKQYRVVLDLSKDQIRFKE